ncbi:MAG: hypothetical protein HY321_04645 [Armatimonadetes bacterium]|nr:hypothetical protein [Armatimonadota bacterium]
MVAILVLLTILGFVLVDWIAQMVTVWMKARADARELAARQPATVARLVTPDQL